MMFFINVLFKKYPEPRAAHHRYSIGGQQLLWGHGGEVGDVRQGVDEGHQWDRNVDGARKVPRGVRTYGFFKCHRYSM